MRRQLGSIEQPHRLGRQFPPAGVVVRVTNMFFTALPIKGFLKDEIRQNGDNSGPGASKMKRHCVCVSAVTVCCALLQYIVTYVHPGNPVLSTMSDGPVRHRWVRGVPGADAHDH